MQKMRLCWPPHVPMPKFHQSMYKQKHRFTFYSNLCYLNSFLWFSIFFRHSGRLTRTEKFCWTWVAPAIRTRITLHHWQICEKRNWNKRNANELSEQNSRRKRIKNKRKRSQNPAKRRRKGIVFVRATTCSCFCLTDRLLRVQILFLLLISSHLFSRSSSSDESSSSSSDSDSSGNSSSSSSSTSSSSSSDSSSSDSDSSDDSDDSTSKSRKKPTKRGHKADRKTSKKSK